MEELNFLKLVSSYDLSNKNINLKYHHSLRVMDLQCKYASLLDFSSEDVYLAKIIGLLHDFGRFEQLKTYNTYVDKISVDHAALGVNLLFREGYIEEFNVPREYYNIIKYAIFNHNKFEVEKTNDEECLKQVKLDILYILSILNSFKELPNDSEISEKVLQNFKKHEQVNLEDVKNDSDRVSLRYSFIYDVNYDVTLPEFKNYYELYYKKMGMEKFKIIYEEVMNYIEMRMNEYARVRKKI